MDILKTIKEFNQKKILVVGDIMLDHYLKGGVSRISPEAPVPVLAKSSESYALGGAGNVAANIASLKGRVTLLGVTGDDPESGIIKKICAGLKITPRLIIEKKRPTTLKTRVVSGRHQLLRIDTETTARPKTQTENELIKTINRLPNFNIIVISDYAKGCLTKKVFTALKNRFKNVQIIADIKPSQANLYSNVFLITPNLKETYDLTGLNAQEPKSAEKSAKLLSDRFSSSVIITRGEHGLTLYEKETKKITHIPSHTIHIFDVTGAGDTVVAVLALMVALGEDLKISARVANLAAGLVVSEEGTATLSPQVLIAALKNRRVF